MLAGVGNGKHNEEARNDAISSKGKALENDDKRRGDALLKDAKRGRGYEAASNTSLDINGRRQPPVVIGPGRGCTLQGVGSALFGSGVLCQQVSVKKGLARSPDHSRVARRVKETGKLPRRMDLCAHTHVRSNIQPIHVTPKLPNG